MHQHSERAMEIAQMLCDGIFYPRAADATSKTILNCAADGFALNAEQTDALYVATLQAWDGVYCAIAYEIDQRVPAELVRPRRAGDGLDGPHDGEAGR